MKVTILLSAVAIAAYPAAASAAPAHSGDGVENIIVTFADLDLRSATGQNRLRDRITYAAYRLCLVDAPASPSPMTADPVCLRDKIQNGVQQMNRVVARANDGSSSAALTASPAR